MNVPVRDPQSELRRLLEIMRRLRDPVAGCAWDRAQDARSLARYTLEEAYELVDAIERQDGRSLLDELGDLLFQVVFHAQLLAERQIGDFADVAAGIADKLERRHPHVFQVPDAHAAPDWEALKRAERAARGATGTLADIPIAMPALGRACKLGRRAAQVGFDWPDADGALEKVREELAEVQAARAAGPGQVREEIGDLLLAVTSLARHLEVDPETALREANRKFEERFNRMDEQARARGSRLQDLSPAEQDELWRRVKSGVQS